MAILSLKDLSKTSSDVVTSQRISDESMNKVRKEYYDVIAYLKAKGIGVNEELALKIKQDLINNQKIMTF